MSHRTDGEVIVTVYRSLYVQILKHLLQDYEVQGTAAVTVWMSMPADKHIEKTHYNIPVVIFNIRISCFRPEACQPISSVPSGVCFKFFGFLFVCFGHLPVECQF